MTTEADLVNAPLHLGTLRRPRKGRAAYAIYFHHQNNNHQTRPGTALSSEGRERDSDLIVDNSKQKTKL